MEGENRKENVRNTALKKAEIILVENNPDHADLIIDILETENIKEEIIIMKGGQKAVDYIQKGYNLE